MRVLVRADATIRGGAGHVLRSAALLDAVRRRGGEAVLAGTVESPLAAAALASADVAVLPAPNDPEGLIRLALEQGADLLHVDTYDDLGDVHPRARAAGVLVSSIEDGVWGRCSADLVIDPRPAAPEEHRAGSGGSELLLGAGYAPLRPELADAAGRDRAVRAPRRVLVLMGGTDAFGATAAVATAVAGIPGLAAIRAVIAPGAPEPEPIDGVELQIVRPTADLLALLEDVDLAVTAAGTSVWEFAALGIPMAVVQVTANQEENYRFLTDGGLALGIGSLDEVRASGVPRELLDLLADPASATERVRRARAIGDGRGAERIVTAWERLVGEPTGVSVRDAHAGDATELFDWRNDPGTREASRTVDAVDWPAHRAWVARVLEDPDRRLYIGRRAHRAIGTLRFDRLPDGAFEISITVAPEARGLGLAGPLVEAGIRRLDREEGAVDVIAVARTGNGASRRLFTSAGFTVEADDGEFVRMILRRS